VDSLTQTQNISQIDHMIPLKEVHLSGGHAWDAEKKQDFANDLDHPQALIAVKGGPTKVKGPETRQAGCRRTVPTGVSTLLIGCRSKRRGAWLWI